MSTFFERFAHRSQQKERSFFSQRFFPMNRICVQGFVRFLGLLSFRDMWKRCGEMYEIVIRSRSIAVRLSTSRTFVHDDETFLRILIETHGLEKSEARRRAISGARVIDVLAVETKRAMITVRSPFERRDVLSALLTDERLFAGDEHRHTLKRKWKISPSFTT